jgi:hypothetical protein
MSAWLGYSHTPSLAIRSAHAPTVGIDTHEDGENDMRSHFGLLTFAVSACAALGCGGQVSLGGRLAGDGGSTGSGSTSGATSTCTAPSASCASTFPGATQFASATDAADVLVGRWLFCDSPDFGSQPGWVGEEFAADGKHYGLVQDASGNAVRDLSPGDIADWTITLADNGSFTLIVGIFDEGIAGLSTCPRVFTKQYQAEELPLPQ